MADRNLTRLSAHEHTRALAPRQTRSTLLRTILPLSLLLIAPFALAQNNAGRVQHNPRVFWELKHDVSPPLRSMPVYHGGGKKHEAEPARRIPLPPGVEETTATTSGMTADAAIQRYAVTPLAATAGLSFDGLGNGQYGFTVNSAPPDTNGAVGTTQYVQQVNSSYAVFNKSTGALAAGPFASNALWSGFGGGCQSNDDG